MFAMPKEQLPEWEEREQPTTYLIDVHEPDGDYAVLPPEDGGQNDDYLAWINEFKRPLHTELSLAHPATVARLELLDIDLNDLSQTVADVLDSDAYPTSRIVTHEDVSNLPAVAAAVNEGFFSEEMEGPTGEALAQFEYILHFIRLRESYLNEVGATDITDTLAFTIGRAALSKVTYAHVGREEGDSVYHWYGYAWRHNDKYVGEIMDDIASSAIAARTRAELGLSADGEELPNPIVERYRERAGIYYSAVGAIAFDILSASAGHNDEHEAHKQIWAFMAGGQDESARAELADTIAKATNGKMTLEAIENTPRDSFEVLALLKKVEEACGIDASKRPSKIITPKIIYT